MAEPTDLVCDIKARFTMQAEAEKEKHGSFDGYIREGLGLSEKEIEALRSSLLE